MQQQKTEEEKLAIIIKAQGLSKFAKMCVNVGKPDMEKIVRLTRYVQSLARLRTYTFLGINEQINFLDKDALKRIQFDPIYGFVWYYQEKGEMETFGHLLLKGEAGDVALGTASEVGAVIPRGKGEMPEVITKKELGMDDRPTTELLKEYRKVIEEEVPDKKKERTEREIIEEAIPAIQLGDVPDQPPSSDEQSETKEPKPRLRPPWEKKSKIHKLKKIA